MKKKAMISITVMIFFIMSIIVVGLIVFAMISQTRLTEGRAFMTYQYIRDEVIVGSDMYYIDAVDGRDGYLDNGTARIRLSPTSGEIRLDKTLLKVITMNDSMIYEFGGVGRNNSKINSKDTGTFGVEFITKSDKNHNDLILNVGEIVQIYFMFPSKVGEDSVVELSLYPHNGRSDTKKIRVPEIVKSERIQLYP